MKKLFLLVVFITVLSLVLIACGQNSAFVGTWTGTTDDDLEMKIVFSSNGNVTLTMGAQGVNGTYTVDGNIATITPDNGSGDATATLADDVLIFIAFGESVELRKR